MIQEYFLIKGICQEHFFFKNFGDSFCFLWYNNLHPFFKRFPFSKHDKEIIFANFVKGFNLIEPFFHRDKFCWFWIYEFGNSFTRKCVIVNNIVFDDLRIWDHIHIVMIIWIFSYHVNEFLCSKFFLPNHFKKCCNFSVLNRNIIFWALFNWREWTFRLKILTWYGMLEWRSTSQWCVYFVNAFSLFIKGKWISSRWSEACQAIVLMLLFVLRFFNTEFWEKWSWNFFLFKGFLFGLLHDEKNT